MKSIDDEAIEAVLRWANLQIERLELEREEEIPIVYIDLECWQGVTKERVK